jgi:hypothetical protein
MRWFVAVTISLVLLGVPAGAAAATPVGLTLSSADVPGLRAAGTGTKVARAALGRATTPRALARVVPRGAAFASGGRRLSIGVFALGTSAAAGRALSQAGNGFVRLGGVAQAARRRTRVQGKTTEAVVLLRYQGVVAAVRFTVPGRATAFASTAAQSYATSLAARLERVLSRTAWQRTLDSIRDDGSITPALALRAFAIAYGPLPGVKRPGGRVGVPRSGTLAMQLVARVWDRLTPAQRTAVNRAVGLPHDAGTLRSTRSAALRGLTPDAGYQAIADKYAAYYTQRIPTTGAMVIQIFKSTEEITNADGAKVPADALPVNDKGEWGVGTPASCRVRVSPTGQKVGASVFEYVMAHEVFHCFQFQLMDAWQHRSAWLVEGSADWAAVTASQAPEWFGAEQYRDYIKQPGKPLFARSYDATGFWGHAEEIDGVGSLWAKFPAIFDAPDDAASYTAAGGAGTPFVNTWASASFRFPSAGSAWNQLSPYAIPHTKIPSPATTLTSGATLGSNPHSLRLYVVAKNPEQSLVNVTRLAGSLRAGTSSDDYGLVSSDWFCFGTCTCPKGQASQLPTHKTVTKGLLALGLTGGAVQGGARVTFHALDEFCGPPQSGVSVSGASTFTVGKGYCVMPFPDTLQVQLPLNAGGTKVAQVVLEIHGYKGAGTYPTGPSVATVYDFRPNPAHLWETPESGSIVVGTAAAPPGHGSSGTVKSVSSGPDADGNKTTVSVTGTWSC